MCDHIDIPGMGKVIVCGLRATKKFCHCGRAAAFLCDWKVRAGIHLVSGHETKTCDRPLCRTHAVEVAPEKHLCPEHNKAWQAWKRAKSAQGFVPEQQNLFPGAAS